MQVEHVTTKLHGRCQTQTDSRQVSACTRTQLCVHTLHVVITVVYWSRVLRKWNVVGHV